MNDSPSSQRWGGYWYQSLKRLRKKLSSSIPFAFGVLSALIALLLYHALFPGAQQLTIGQVKDTVAQALASATPPPAFSASVYRVIQPSLVLIQSQSPDNGKGGENGLGSGVVINEQGAILTSLHVVANAADGGEIRVTFADGTKAEAQILATQPENDIAVLGPSQLPAQVVPATLGNPNAMHVGDEAYVVGNPFGLYGSMSAGIISGFDRFFQPPGREQPLKGLIQIDAAVNPGNSGGPLLNRYGQVIGIIVGIVNPTDQDVFIGIGFAVPIDIAGAAAGTPPY